MGALNIKKKNKHGRVGVRCVRQTRGNLKRQAFRDGYKEGKRVYSQDLANYTRTVHQLMNELLRTSAAARIHARIRAFLEKGV